MSDPYFEFRIRQDGMTVAQVGAPSLRRALGEISHYAMLYAEEGPMEIQFREVPDHGKALRWKTYPDLEEVQ